MKTCNNCKFMKDGTLCTKGVDLVSGGPAKARDMRKDQSKCGPDGIWFEQAVEDWREPRDVQGYRTF